MCAGRRPFYTCWALYFLFFPSSSSLSVILNEWTGAKVSILKLNFSFFSSGVKVWSLPFIGGPRFGILGGGGGGGVDDKISFDIFKLATSARTAIPSRPVIRAEKARRSH